MHYFKYPSHLRHRTVTTSGFCKSLQLGDFSCWNPNAIRNTYSLENNSIFEKQNMAATAFREQSQAGPWIRNPITPPSQEDSDLKRRRAITSLSVFLQLLSPTALRTLAEHPGAAPEPCSGEAGLWAALGPAERDGAVCRDTDSSARTSAVIQPSSVTVSSPPPRTHQECPVAGASYFI